MPLAFRALTQLFDVTTHNKHDVADTLWDVPNQWEDPTRDLTRKVSESLTGTEAWTTRRICALQLRGFPSCH